MELISRRRAVKTMMALGGFAALRTRLAISSDFGLEKIGKLKPRSSRSIAASPLSAGFETLDRKMFEPEKTYAHLAALGVKWARCQTGWARTETTKGKFDFAWLDAVVDSLLKIGIQPWFNVGYGNPLYTPDAPDASAVGWVPFNSGEATDAWRRFVRELASHFGGRVRHFEIWNEPNISGFWHPTKPDAAKYVEMVKLTAPIIRERVPGATIIGGAMAGMPFSYLEGCLKAGLADFVDKISFHPYRPIPEKKYADEVKAFRDLIARFKPNIPLWQGENGCPSKPGSAGALSQQPWDETKQAKWVLRRILSDLRLGIELTSYFHTVDMMNYNWGKGATGKANTKGLLRGEDYTPKPSYFAYQALCALFDAETKKADKQLAPPDGQNIVTASFTRRGQPLHVYWQPADLHQPFTPAKITLPIPALDQPMLVDPLTRQIYKLAATNEPLPLLDYPLIITTAAVAFGETD